MRVRKDALARFLTTLASSGNVSLAASAAKLPRGTLYHWRDRDKGFAAAWLEAIEAATDALEAEARRRAVEGVETTIVHGGRLVRDEAGKPLTIRRYSDSLLALLLRAHRPEKYRDKSAPGPGANVGDGGPRRVSFTFRIGEHKRDDEDQPASPDRTGDG
jgi:AcrR family transcriptional regulator